MLNFLFAKLKQVLMDHVLSWRGQEWWFILALNSKRFLVRLEAKSKQKTVFGKGVSQEAFKQEGSSSSQCIMTIMTPCRATPIKVQCWWLADFPVLVAQREKVQRGPLEKGPCLQLDSLRIEIWGGFYNCVFHLLLLYDQQIQRKSADEQKESWKWQKDKKKIIVQRKKSLSCKVAWKLPYHLGEKSHQKI